MQHPFGPKNGGSAAAASAAASSTEKGSTGPEPKLEHKGDVLHKAEKSVAGPDKDTQELRKKLYDDCVQGGELQVSSKAKYEPKWIQLQAKCKHKFEELRWGANGTSYYASCRACGLNSVIC